MKLNNAFFVLSFVFFLGFQSCVVTKMKFDNKSLIETEQKKGKFKKISIKKFFKLYKQNFPNYKNLYVKFKVKYQENDDSKSLKGIIKNVRDSVIIISLYHSSGIPIAKMKFTKDSIFLNDRLNKQFFQYDYNYILEKFSMNLTYQNIEAILFAEPFVYGDTVFNEKKIKDFKLYKDKDSSTLVFQSVKNKKIKKLYKKTKKGKKLSHKLISMSILQQIIVDPKEILIKKIIIKDLINKNELFVSYDDCSNLLDDKKFVKLLNVKINSKGEIFSFKVKYYKVKEKETMKLKFSIPDYENK